jgi:hypothetical protein
MDRAGRRAMSRDGPERGPLADLDTGPRAEAEAQALLGEDQRLVVPGHGPERHLRGVALRPGQA